MSVAVAVLLLVGRQRPAPPTAGGVLPPRPPEPVVESVPVRLAPAEAEPQVPPAATAPAPDSARSPAPAPATTPIAAAEPAGPGQPERRFANTWVNLRAGRGNASPVVRILRPGDPVLVDSLRLGWYRVVAGGETVGYVDRSFLDRTPR
ncbi:MAG: SH3 domain-containing protein [Gemmatimonadales bacterium]